MSKFSGIPKFGSIALKELLNSTRPDTLEGQQSPEIDRRSFLKYTSSLAVTAIVFDFGLQKNAMAAVAHTDTGSSTHTDSGYTNHTDTSYSQCDNCHSDCNCDSPHNDCDCYNYGAVGCLGGCIQCHSENGCNSCHTNCYGDCDSHHVDSCHNNCHSNCHTNCHTNSTDCGLRFQDSSGTVIPACDPTGTSKLRIKLSGQVWGIVLVSPGDANASKIRVQTSSGTMAIRKYP